MYAYNDYGLCDNRFEKRKNNYNKFTKNERVKKKKKTHYERHIINNYIKEFNITTTRKQL